MALVTSDAFALDGTPGTDGANAGPTVTIFTNGATSTGTVTGANGGASTAGGNATPANGNGGRGGNGGAGGVAVSSTVPAGSTVSITGTDTGGNGSAGSNGGNGIGTGNGGNGGTGGSGGAGVSADGNGTTNAAGTITGGNAAAGGAGGTGVVNGTAGNAGTGGAGVKINAGGTINIGGVATTVTGGSGVAQGVGAAAGISGFGIDASAAGAGAVINLTGAVITPGAAGGGTAQPVAITANGGTTINFSGVNTVNGGLTSTGIVSLGTVNTTTVTGAISLVGATLQNTIQATQATSGQIVGNTAVTNTLVNTLVQPTVTGVGLANGDKVVLIKNNTGTASNLTGAHAATASGTFAPDTTTNTVVRVWSVGDGSTAGFGGTDKFGAIIAPHDVVLLATINSAATITGNRSVGQSAAFDTAANLLNNNTNSSLVTLNQAVQNLNTVDGVRRAADQLRPEASGATSEAAHDALDGLVGATDTRLRALRTATMLSGESPRGLTLWAQGFGGVASQDSRDNFTGFNVQTYGLAAGGDVRVLDNFRVGVAVGYANGKVDEKDNRAGDNLKINSYLTTLYASYIGKPVYVDVSTSFGRHGYDSTRIVTLPDFGATANAAFNGTQYGAKAEVGLPVPVAGNVFVTPLVTLAYTHLNVDSYTESGSTGANLSVSGQRVDSFRSGLGARIDTTLFKSTEWTLKPSLQALWTHEFKTDPLNTTASFSAGSNTFVTSGVKPQANAIVLSAALDLLTSSNVTASLAYQAELKQGFVGHSGLLQVRYSF